LVSSSRRQTKWTHVSIIPPQKLKKLPTCFKLYAWYGKSQESAMNVSSEYLISGSVALLIFGVRNGRTCDTITVGIHIYPTSVLVPSLRRVEEVR
jgi:hypothetical protein